MSATVASDGAVSLRGVGKTYANGVVALDRLDLDVRPGEFVSLLGPSGCGKSTALRLIAGLSEPSRGDIIWAGAAADAPGTPSHARDIGLGSFSAAYPRELSGGMKMRASIARALVTDANLLLMDEPFAALDEITRFKLNDDLLALWHALAKTVVFVTHSVFESVYLSRRIIVMTPRPGRVFAELAIEAPYPRGEGFRTSAEYAAYCRRASETLSKAMAAAA